MASIQDSPVKKKKGRKRTTPLGKRCMIHVFEKKPGKNDRIYQCFMEDISNLRFSFPSRSSHVLFYRIVHI